MWLESEQACTVEIFERLSMALRSTRKGSTKTLFCVVMSGSLFVSKCLSFYPMAP